MSKELVQQYNESANLVFNERPSLKEDRFTIENGVITINFTEKEIEQLSRHLTFSLFHDGGDLYTRTQCRVPTIYSICGIMNYINDTLHGRWGK